MATLENFRKLSLRVGQIVDAQDHPNADRLYVLTVDLGDIKKQIVAGIRIHYTKEELQGKKCIVIDNLDTAILRGVESHGMLLAAKDAKTLSLVTLEKEVALGSPVT